jgi:hypothetical protein
MSEKDMKLGGIAVTKFIDKSISKIVAADGNNYSDEANAYSGTTAAVYKTSDQVRDHYFRQIDHQHQQAHNDDSPFSSSSNRQGGQQSSTTPTFWKERQEMRQLEAEGYRNQEPAVPASAQPSSETSGSASAHVALVKVATHALESFAGVLEHDSTATIPMEDRAAFAKAIQRAMQALAAAKSYN